MINLKVRLKQKWFYLTMIPLLFLLGDQIYDLVIAIQSFTVGDVLYGGAIEAAILAAVGTVFAIVGLIAAPVDTTTSGYGDSARALDYDVPAPNAAQTAKELEELSA